MRLNFDEIKRITTGALFVRETDGGFEFDKCTPQQVAFWATRSDVLHMRSRATSGVRLDFHSNTKKLSYRISTQSNEHGKTEVLVDGIGVYTNELGESREQFDIGEGEEHRITVIFPSHEIGTLHYIEIDDGATLMPHEYKMKILFFGDSITQGSRAPISSLSYAYRTSFYFDADSVVQGVGGGFFYNGIFDSAIEYEPDVMIIAYGTNDYARYTEFDVISQRARDVVAQIRERYPSTKIFGITPLRRYDIPLKISTGEFDELRARIAEIFRESGICVVDGYDLLDDNPALYDDGLHPNADGFVQYTKNLCSFIEEHI